MGVCACCSSHTLRPWHCLSRRDEQRIRSPRLCIYHLHVDYPYHIRIAPLEIFIIRRRHLPRCFVVNRILIETARFQSVKEQNVKVNVLSICMLSPPIPLCRNRAYQRKDVAKIGILLYSAKKIPVFLSLKAWRYG